MRGTVKYQNILRMKNIIKNKVYSDKDMKGFAQEHL